MGRRSEAHPQVGQRPVGVAETVLIKCQTGEKHDRQREADQDQAAELVLDASGGRDAVGGATCLGRTVLCRLCQLVL